jgi:hypothetical protein
MRDDELSEEEMIERFKSEEVLPEAPPDLAAQIWAEISPGLRPHTRPAYRRWLFRWQKPLVAIAACLLLFFTFTAGRVWEQQRHVKQTSEQRTAERILLIGVADHLERSERFLVELRVSGAANPELASTANELLNDNRLYLQSAIFTRDADMTSVLDRLGRVLVEVAHGQPMSMPGLVQKDWRLGDLLQAIRAEQRRTPVRT